MKITISPENKNDKKSLENIYKNQDMKTQIKGDDIVYDNVNSYMLLGLRLENKIFPTHFQINSNDEEYFMGRLFTILEKMKK